MRLASVSGKRHAPETSILNTEAWPALLGCYAPWHRGMSPSRVFALRLTVGHRCGVTIIYFNWCPVGPRPGRMYYRGVARAAARRCGVAQRAPAPVNTDKRLSMTPLRGDLLPAGPSNLLPIPENAKQIMQTSPYLMGLRRGKN